MKLNIDARKQTKSNQVPFNTWKLKKFSHPQSSLHDLFSLKIQFNFLQIQNFRKFSDEYIMQECSESWKKIKHT